MENNELISQNPACGESFVKFCGDLITFTLQVPEDVEGEAWIRTELGRASILRREIINWIDNGEIKLNEQWHDIKMQKKDQTLFSITLPLYETGHFNAKCFFLAKDSTSPVWPVGDNCVINVEPAGTCCANIIYNAFVRQFGRSKYASQSRSSCGIFAAEPDSHSSAPGAGPSGSSDAAVLSDETHLIEQLDKKGYSVIPASGKFRDLTKEVEFIFSSLGCRALHLLPVHPVPTTYARMGRFGSPYAALNFAKVDAALAEFDPSATPLEQFMELADTVHLYNGYLILDIAINHTGWAAVIHESHPEWLVRGEDGKIEVPGAWGIEWEDLTKLDYSKKELWQYMADIFLLWCHRGVDGFRCDAGYMIPVPAWEYMVARVKVEYPDTLFFLEGLGGPIVTTCDILNRANFNWAYSELFQNYDRTEIETYLTQSFEISKKYGQLINFAETHDNLRLASVSTEYAMMRTSICALFSVCGGFGFANGVEWFATKKIDVHESPSLNWDSEINQVDHIKRLNLILKNHPCFADQTELKFIQKGDGNYGVLVRYHIPTKKTILVIANFDSCQCSDQNSGQNSDQCSETGIEGGQRALWKSCDLAIEAEIFYDLITGREIKIGRSGEYSFIELAPFEVLALSNEKNDLDILKKSDIPGSKIPDRVLLQKFKSLAMKIFSFFNGFGDVDVFNPEIAAKQIAVNPVEFIRSLGPDKKESRVIIWQWEKDVRRKVMVPPGYFLIVFSKLSFRAAILERNKQGFTVKGNEESLPMNNGGIFDNCRADGNAGTNDNLEADENAGTGARAGTDNKTDDNPELCSFGHFGHFAIFMPLGSGTEHKEYDFRIRVFAKDKIREEKSSLLYLANPHALKFSCDFSRKEIVADPGLKLLGTTSRGGMMRSSAGWSRLESRYDGLIAANLNKDYPENRWMLLSRFRIWAMYQGYSRELDLDCLEQFSFSYQNSGKWLFRIPTCDGNHFLLKLYLELNNHSNSINMRIERNSSEYGEHGESFLSSEKKVTIIIRPDIEDRSFHETVKAFTGPEDQWKKHVTIINNGFLFAPVPDQRHLKVRITNGNFVWEPEWNYMVHRPVEAQRGLDAESDLFSPGYFITSLYGDESVLVNADADGDIVAKADSSSCFFHKAQSKERFFRDSDPHDKSQDQSRDQSQDQSQDRSQDQFQGKSQDQSRNPKFKIQNIGDAALASLDTFIVQRGKYKSVIAGYPWFLDWGRDSLIFCRSLIEAKRFEDAKDILRLFGKFEKNGTLPNMICGENAENRETSDAPLWFFVCVKELVEKDNHDFLDEILEQRSVKDILISLAQSMIKGTDTGVVMDNETSLLYSPSHFTWMDTNYPAGSPRQGYPVEIQALWYSALAFLAKTDKKENFDQWNNIALAVSNSIKDLFFIKDKGFFSDCLHCDSPLNAAKAEADDALRPNQLFLITLGAVTDEKLSIKCVESCMELLVPGAIRSLADEKVLFPLVIEHNGELLKDPHYPYSGRYAGDEDYQRKPAYHNGTAWTWPFPVFCEAYADVFGSKGSETALAWLGSSSLLMEKGCAGFIPEILDGDAPHTERGCDAQAWGSSELTRVWLKLSKK